MEKKKILFICTHNSARSQIAEGLINGLYNKRYSAFSAGTVKSSVNPFAIKVLKDLNLNPSGLFSKTIDFFKDEYFDLVVTVCDSAREECPFFPACGKIQHASFPDPSGTRGSEDDKLLSFSKTRDQIHSWIKNSILNKL